MNPASEVLADTATRRGPPRAVLRWSLIAAGLSAVVAAAESPPEETPERSAFFGDLHIHTMYSHDAFLASERNTPDDAYRYAKGESINHRTGGTVQLSGPPLDFLAVTDHAEYLGVDLAGQRHKCERRRWGPACQNLMRDAWQREIEAAQRHNDPGNFTALIGYEYGPNSPNALHRNVIFKSANVPATLFSAWNSEDPQRLWVWLDAQRAQGRHALAIPHNSNRSSGAMFQRTTVEGQPIDAAYAEQRRRNEPLVEVNQIKGASEVHPTLSPNDEWADFQIMPGPRRVSALQANYWRSALNAGLELEEQLGPNPYQLGVVGGSDTHISAGSYEEDSYFTNRSRSPEQRTEVFQEEEDGWASVAPIRNKALQGTGGLTGIWADANTRAALFEALSRRETFGTSGPRIRVRLFGGFGLAERLAEAEDEVAAAYAYGVPMGSVLRDASDDAPSFLVWAMRDPRAGRLQRLQVVKGWLEDGVARESVIDVACSDGLTPDPETGRCPENGAGVDLADCSVSQDNGAATLRTVWTDPDFDPAQRSYYYVRVLENPSCRWSTWDAVRLGVEPNPGLPATHQERAWSSPIWFDDLSANTELAALSLSEADIGPFSASTASYAVSVDSTVDQATVQADPRHANAAVEIAPTDSDSDSPGHQIALAKGLNTITVTVTAEDTAMASAYTVTVTRAAQPTMTLAADADAVTEGAALTFTVASSEALASALTLPVAVTEDRALLAAAPPTSVTFATGSSTASFAVATEDDAVVEGDGSVTVMLLAGDGYGLGDRVSASVRVEDDDVATYAATVDSTEIEEGDSTTVTVSIDNGVTLAETQALELEVTGDVSVADYTLEPVALTLPAGSSSVTATFTAVDDGVDESLESATVTARLDGDAVGSATVTLKDRPAPVISGIPQVGSVLKASFEEELATAPTYRWLRAGEEIGGATGATYAPTAADVGAMLSVGASRGDRTLGTAATGPVWAAPLNPPVGADEEELLKTLLTVGSTDAYPFRLGGYGRLLRASFGSVERSAMEADGTEHALRGASVSAIGAFGLLWAPDPVAAEELVVYWDGYRIGPLSGNDTDEGSFWVASTPQPRTEYLRYTDGSSNGVRVALSIRRPLPAPAVTLAALEEAVAEGSAAMFEVKLNRPARADLPVAIDIAEDGAVLLGEPPGSVTVVAGATTGTLSASTDDDAVVEDAGSVTATLRPGDGYTLGDATTATVEVEDDDEASFSVTAEPSELIEGEESMFRVSIENGVTFAEAQPLTLSVTGDLSATEYTLDPETLEIAVGESSTTATFTALSDEEEEESETARIGALLDGVEVGDATVSIRLPSTDATLADLLLSDVEIGDFDSATTTYTGTATADIESTTVEATLSDANADVEIADAAGSTLGTQRTSQLSVGVSEIEVRVTAEDGETERTYTAAVTREPTWGARLPERDIELAGTGQSTGVWSDGVTVWTLPDWQGNSARAYDLATGARQASLDVPVREDRSYTALWSDGATLWAASYWGEGAHAYRLSDGAMLNEANLDESLSAAGNDVPTGLWSNGELLFAADNSDAHVYVYDTDGTRQSAREFGLRTGDVRTGWPWGIWSDGQTLLTSWYGRGTLRAYRLSDGTRLPAYDIDAGSSDNDDPRDLWSDGQTLWVMDGTDGKLYAYAVPGLRRVVSGASALSLGSRAVGVPANDPGAPVTLPDPGLRRRVERALGKSPGDVIGAHELAALESLDLRGAGVRELGGLEHAANLAALDLGGNGVLDVRVLTWLPKLTALNVDGALEGPWALAGLTGLVRLSVRNNGLENITALGTMTGLTVLDIGGNRVTELAPLAGLSRLATLRADGNAIRDVTPLAGLVSLVTVDLSDNGIEDVSALEGWSASVEIDLHGNPVAAQSQLPELPGSEPSERGRQEAPAAEQMR